MYSTLYVHTSTVYILLLQGSKLFLQGVEIISRICICSDNIHYFKYLCMNFDQAPNNKVRVVGDSLDNLISSRPVKKICRILCIGSDIYTSEVYMSMK